MKPRDNCFDFLRLAAAMCVVVQHSVHHLNAPFLWIRPGVTFWFYDGVPLFFILSGLLVYRSVEICSENRRPVWHFYVNRFLRIGPALYTYLLIVTVMLIGLGVLDQSTVLSTRFIAWLASNVGLFPVYNPPFLRGFGVGEINGSLWTIPVEVGFYLVCPFLYWLEQKFGFRRFMVTLAVLAGCGMALLGWTQSLGQATTLAKVVFLAYPVTFFPHLLFFSLGIFWLRNWKHVPQRGWLAAACFVLYILLRWDALGLEARIGPIYQALWALPLSYSVIWFGYRGPLFVNAIMRLGDMSYGAYIWHMVVVNLLVFAVAMHPALAQYRAWGVPLTIAVTVLLAMTSWRFVERPFLQLKPFTSRRSAEPASVTQPVGGQ